MSPHLELKYSKSKVNAAGKVLGAGLPSKASRDDVTLWVDSRKVAAHFRQCHSYPLQQVNIRLRYYVGQESATVVVAQRLKRMVTIIDKLHREPEMALARMQDLGGVRAVLPDMPTLIRVAARIRRSNWKPQPNKIKDYIASPAPSGYRSLHIIVQQLERQIEIQLRTPIQHEWAIAVERMGQRSGYDLKSGKGPEPVLRFLALASEGMAMEERGDPVPETFLTTYAQARQDAAQWLT